MLERKITPRCDFFIIAAHLNNIHGSHMSKLQVEQNVVEPAPT